MYIVWRSSNAGEIFYNSPIVTTIIQIYKGNERDKERYVLMHINSWAIHVFFMQRGPAPKPVEIDRSLSIDFSGFWIWR